MSTPQSKSIIERFTQSHLYEFIRSLVQPHPEVEDVGERHQAQLLSMLSLVFFVLLAIGTLASLLSSLMRGQADYTSALLMAVITALTGVPYMLSRTEDYRIGSIMMVGALSAASFALMFMQGAASISAIYSFIPMAFVLGSVLLSLRGMAILVAADSLCVVVIPTSMPGANFSDVVTPFAIILVLGILLMATMAFRDSIERGRIEVVNSANIELKTLHENLEQRVAERTLALETSTQVSRRLSTILDQKELVSAVVEEVQKAFNYYHAHIYLFDKAHENLVMAGGTGEAGEILLARGHKIPKGMGLVGRAAESNEVVLVPNTTRDPDWLPNPLLPDTKSEIAVPISSGETVLGVLDVQQSKVNGLSAQDADMLSAIASQVAVALQNASLYDSMQQQAERETMVNLVSQKIQMATTMEDVLRVAVRELGSALGVQRATIEVGGLSKGSGGNGRNEA